MDTINIQDILPLVETPSRYLGCEANSILKSWDQVDLTFALSFPDLYEIGTSHFGMQILYTILNGQDHIAAERFFTPAPDMETLLQEKKIPLFSLESKRPLKAFDIIGFSLLYELNFTNILTMMHLGDIPFYAEERNRSPEAYPLIIGGGPCAFNPEPLADFFDAFVIGDGEETVLEISEAVIQWKNEHNKKSADRNDLLTTLSKIQGVYIPSFFKATYKPLERVNGKKEKRAPFFDDPHQPTAEQTSPPSPLSMNGEEENTATGVDSNEPKGCGANAGLKNETKEKRKETFQYLEPLIPGYERIKRAILRDLTMAAFPTSPVVPFGKPVHDRLRLEVARGCSRGCRFCQAGMIYRPVRERSVENLATIAETSMKETGYSDISLLSLSTGDYSNLAPLMSKLLTINPGHRTALSLPSVRAGKLTAPLMEIIKSVKKTGFTIAPEAGTQRLRDVINKNITEEDIFTTVNSAFELGWRTIKLYFMNGLPTETDEDIKGIVDLAQRLISSPQNRNHGGGKGKGGKKAKGRLNINVSFATFIPKAHTPFQRCAQIPPEKSLANLAFLKTHLHHPGIKLKWQNPWMSLLEGVWARGDRRLSKVLVSAWKKGCRLDGWSDQFNINLWHEAFEETGIDPLFYTARERSHEEPLPWDHIDCGISNRYMEKELENALAGRITEDCRDHDCTGCGICDFKKIQPVLFPETENLSGTGSTSLEDNVPTPTGGGQDTPHTDTPSHATKHLDSPPVNPFRSASEKTSLNSPSPSIKTGLEGDVDGQGIKERSIKETRAKAPIPDDHFTKLTLFYSRMGDARHFGHLELAKIIRRAIRRTGITVKYSRGFSPAMKMAFDNPLPVGMESEEEFFHIHAHIKTDTHSLVERLNQVLPRSITMTRCLPASKLKQLMADTVKQGSPTRYRIDLKNHTIAQDEIDAFMALSEYLVDQVTHKGVRRQTDLRKMTRSIHLIPPNDGHVSPPATPNSERFDKPLADNSFQINAHGLRPTTNHENFDMAMPINRFQINSSRIEMVLVKNGERTIRPTEILMEVFDIPEAVLRVSDTIKLKTAI